MDAAGFPAAPESAIPAAVVWLVLAALAATVVVVAFRVLKGPASGAAPRVLAVAVVLGVVIPAMVLLLPARAQVGTDTVSGSAECPLPTIDGAFMGGNPKTGLYEYWKPCVSSSRLRLSLALGGYAIAVGLAGVVATRTRRRQPRPVPAGRG